MNRICAIPSNYTFRLSDLALLSHLTFQTSPHLDLAPPQSKRFCHHVTQPFGGATRFLLRTTATSPSGGLGSTPVVVLVCFSVRGGLCCFWLPPRRPVFDGGGSLLNRLLSFLRWYASLLFNPPPTPFLWTAVVARNKEVRPTLLWVSGRLDERVDGITLLWSWIQASCFWIWVRFGFCCGFVWVTSGWSFAAVCTAVRIVICTILSVLCVCVSDQSGSRFGLFWVGSVS